MKTLFYRITLSGKEMGPLWGSDLGHFLDQILDTFFQMRDLLGWDSGHFCGSGSVEKIDPVRKFCLYKHFIEWWMYGFSNQNIIKLTQNTWFCYKKLLSTFLHLSCFPCISSITRTCHFGEKYGIFKKNHPKSSIFKAFPYPGKSAWKSMFLLWVWARKYLLFVK